MLRIENTGPVLLRLFPAEALWDYLVLYANSYISQIWQKNCKQLLQPQQEGAKKGNLLQSRKDSLLHLPVFVCLQSHGRKRH